MQINESPDNNEINNQMIYYNDVDKNDFETDHDDSNNMVYVRYNPEQCLVMQIKNIFSFYFT